LYLLCAQRLDLPTERVLAVGDRLDTDIEGAVAAGMDSLLVLTGVDDLRACLLAPPHRRPTYVAPDLRALLADPDVEAETVAALTAAVRAGYAAMDAGSAPEQVETFVARAEGVVEGAAHR
jgi:beta-phosphoglucomutase-like phosphatase (HAD superfamily)